jgi:hypothetical protein
MLYSRIAMLYSRIAMLHSTTTRFPSDSTKGRIVSRDRQPNRGLDTSRQQAGNSTTALLYSTTLRYTQGPPPGSRVIRPKGELYRGTGNQSGVSILFFQKNSTTAMLHSTTLRYTQGPPPGPRVSRHPSGSIERQP